MDIFSVNHFPFVNKSIIHPLLEPQEIPIIGVECDASAELGIKHSILMDATQSVAVMEEQISEMLSKSPASSAKGYTIYGVQKLTGVQNSVGSAHDEAVEILKRILNRKAVREKLIAYYNGNLDLVDEALSDYQGAYQSELEFATEHFNESYTEDCCPHCCYDFKVFNEYIDYEKCRRELFSKRYFSVEARGKVHILMQPRSLA